MNPSLADTGNLIEKAEHFGERFGFPAIISILVVGSLMFALYTILDFEIKDSKVKINAMGSDMSKMMDQHAILIRTTDTSLKIQCATCWNTADNQSEIKRCSCSL